MEMEHGLHAVTQHVKDSLVGNEPKHTYAQQQHCCHKAAVTQLAQGTVALIPVDENHEGTEHSAHGKTHQKALQLLVHLLSSC